MSGKRDPIDDRELVERVRAGHRYAFNVLVWKWEKRIYNLALRMLGSEEDAAEVCQEVFLKAYTHIHDFRGDAQFATWLYRIAINCCRNRLRRRRRQRRVIADVVWSEAWTPGAIDPPTVDAETRIHQAMLMERVQQALLQLPEEQRMVIELRILQDCSVDEVAQIMGIPPGTVKSRLFYGIRRLRDLLKDVVPSPSHSPERPEKPA